jgi:hypothetical protein
MVIYKRDTEAPVISTVETSHNLGCNPTVTDPLFTATDNCEGTVTQLLQLLDQQTRVLI